MFYETTEPLVSSDTDDCEPADPGPNGCGDVYQYDNGTTSLVSAGATGGFDAKFRGASEDGGRVFFISRGQFAAQDTDAAQDIYQRAGGVTTLLSDGSTGGNGSFDAIYRGASADGTRVFFTTTEQLVAADTDAEGDVYERSGGTTTLLSTGPSGGNGAQDASFRGASQSGNRVLIETAEQLVAADTDSSIDVYERAGGTTTLLSTGPPPATAPTTRSSSPGPRMGHTSSSTRPRSWSHPIRTRWSMSTSARAVRPRCCPPVPPGGNGAFDAFLQDANESGSRVVIGTQEGLVSGDTDGRTDLYERVGGSTLLVSAGGNGPFDAFFSGASADGGKIFFETSEPLSGDSDAFPDVYERSNSATTRVSIGTGGGNGAQIAVFSGASDDGSRVWFVSAEKLATTDTDVGTDVFESLVTAAYPRPKSANSMELPLVVAYDSCTSPNRLHGPPVIGGGGPNASCSPPQPASDHLTVGSPDSNGQVAKAVGRAVFTTIAGNPANSVDDADVRLALNMSDVRRQSGLADYTGELQVAFSLSVVDKYNGAEPVDRAAGSAIGFSFTAACDGTPDTTVGSTCGTATTADALIPGAVVEGARAIWQIGAVEVRDGGADGVASTTPNTPFLRQGVFVP